MMKFGGVAGVSYLCHGSGCSGVSCARMFSTSGHLRSLLLFSLYSVTRSLLFSSYPVTLFIKAFLCAAAPSSLLAESWKEIRKEGARGESEWVRERGRVVGLAMGQIGSQLSVRPFITYLWLCAHLRCRTHIQNYYYCVAYCQMWCYSNWYWWSCNSRLRREQQLRWW